MFTQNKMIHLFALLFASVNVIVLPAKGIEYKIDTSQNEIEDYSSNHFNSKSPASQIHDEVDILKIMNISAKDRGASIVEGPIKTYPAYKIRLLYGNVPLANSTEVAKAMNNSRGFTAIFLYRQQKNNLGTLISVNSPGRLTPWFQINSNSKTGLLTLKYRVGVKAEKLKQVDWVLPKHHRKSPLAAWTWLSLSIDFEAGVIKVDLDCLPSRFQSLGTSREFKRVYLPPDAIVYFGQEPGRKKKFLGSFQVAKVIPFTTVDRVWKCSKIAENLPPQYRKPVV